MTLTIEERSSNLELDMNTTRDTIWRLTNRVCILEEEFRRLKDLLKRSVLKPSVVQNSPKEKAKLSEKARGARLETGDENEEPDLEQVKTEIYSDSECNESDNDGPPDCMSEVGSIISVKGSQRLPQTKLLGNATTYNSSQECNDEDDYSPGSGTDEDYEPNIRIKCPRDLFDRKSKGGRKKSNIWVNFIRMDVVSENGQKTVTICKHCKSTVSSRGERLRKHMERCAASTNDSLIPKKVIKTYTKPDICNEKGSSPNYETIAAEAVSLSPPKSGRKRTPIWKHFIRKPKPEMPDKPSRKYSVIAICKNCKAEVSSKAGRMTTHLQKCLSGITNTKPLGTLKQIIPGSSDMRLCTPFKSDKSKETSTENGDSTFSATNIDNVTTCNNNNPNTTVSNCDNTNSEAMSNCRNESTMEISSSRKNNSTNKRSSVVWQHYNVTKIISNGKPCVGSAACKYCKKLVSPKSGRLMLHLKKCPSALAPDPASITLNYKC